ncbi:MAG: DUF4175 family protein [Myxococcales bacterium]|nr:DUF4175 family protein [Myxococcales bacterium]
MFPETSSAQGRENPTPPPLPARQEVGHARLIREVRSHARRQLWLRGALWGISAALLLLTAAAFAALASPLVGRLLAFAAPLAFLGLLLFHGIWVAFSQVGDDPRAARLAGGRLPSLSFDLLAAVELRRALGRADGFSKQLARAFLEQVDAQAGAADVRLVVDGRRVRPAAAALSGALLLGCAAIVAWPSAFLRGARAALRVEETPVGQAREPITGDVELTYRYPAYTGLAPRTVPGTSGEVSAPAGTEVQISTRADREVARAELVVNGKSVPLGVSGGRDLSGSFVVDKPGHYHFAFQKRSGKVAARGPEVPIHVETDAAPQVKLVSPLDELEIDPGESVTLRYDASDDYGLSKLELVFRPPGKSEDQRVPLKHDEGRRSKGQYVWDVGALELEPGQRVTYFLEVRDNDEVEGHKKGVSRTQSLKLYSAAEHRREAVRKAERLWERMVLHLADRLEGPDRAPEKDLGRVSAAQSVDASAFQLATDLLEAARELSAQRDSPEELYAALVNIGEATRKMAMGTSDARRMFLRFHRARGLELDGARRLVQAAVAEIAGTERNVLYLESLLDRQKMRELRELALQLQRDRRELASLIEQFRQTKDEKLKEDILREVQRMRERIDELMRRMGELAKGIRDEHLNQEALRELMRERDLSSALDEMERLLREGKVEEALAKLQELAMQMEEMLQQLEDAEEDAAAEQNPELTRKFQKFIDELRDTAAEQKELAERTKEIRDRYKEQLKERLSQRGKTLKEELLRKAEEVAKDYQSLSPEQLPRADQHLELAQSELENLKNALKVEDYDLAALAAARAKEAARRLADEGDNQRRLDERFQNPPEVQQQSRKMAERLRHDATKVEEIDRKLQDLFPPPGSMLSEEDREELRQMSGEQRGLERRAQGLQQRMEEMDQLAPIFGEEAQEQMGQISERMGGASQRLEMRDPSRGHGEQKAALDQLQQFQRQMQQSKGRGGKGGGLPLPMMAGRRRGWGHHDQERVEIPDEEQFQAPKELRKDLLEAMKQGAPDRYRDQVKRYYEELVK